MTRGKVKLMLISVILTAIALGSCTKKEVHDERVVLNPKYKDEILKSRELLAVNLITSRTGLSVSVSVDNETVWSEGIGYSSSELSTVVKPEHKFRIGTSSRLFTSLILLRMHERGEIDLNKNYSDYVSSGVNPNWNFNLYQLAVNSAGLGFYTSELFKEAIRKEYRNLDELLAAHQQDELRYPLNENFAENAVGTCMLVEALRGESGKRYKQLLYDEVLKPFGLSETELDYPHIIIKNKATLYSRNSIAQVFRASDGNIRAVAPAMGILSTADDLNKLGQAILKHEVLTPESYDLLLTPNKLNNGDDSAWGMGIEVAADREGRKFYLLRGEVDGGASLLIICPEEKLVFSVCGNLSNDYTSYPFSEVLGLFMEKLSPKK
ncbi:MAG: serine hydrolase domain-containing protein [Mangrovibacterium sp.]